LQKLASNFDAVLAQVFQHVSGILVQLSETTCSVVFKFQLVLVHPPY